MNGVSGRLPGWGRAADFLATVWPLSLPTDTDLQRRKKVAVRSGQLAVVLMVSAAVTGAIVADFGRYTALHVAALITASVVYVAWSLYGMRNAVRVLLWEWGEPPNDLWGPGTRLPTIIYFAVQLSLAALVYSLGDQGHSGAMVWLVLLPPIAHGVILLPRSGIAAVAAVAIGILVCNIVYWQGWKPLPYLLLSFAFAVLFTLVFTLLAVSSERARSQVQRLAAELSAANRKLREYAVQAEELAATRERNRLAREIHDTLGHYLTVVNVQLEAARAVQERDPGRAQDAMGKAQALTQEGLQEIRRSVAALRASPLDNQSLVEALRQVVAESGTSGLPVELRVIGQERELSPQAELTLFRAGQEGLTNVRKHARASKAHLTIDYSSKGKARLTVTDNGAGAAGEAAGGFGLLGLRERAQLLGGAVRVQTVPGAGFTLEVEVPA